jgi:hypothetical protein
MIVQKGTLGNRSALEVVLIALRLNGNCTIRCRSGRNE